VGGLSAQLHKFKQMLGIVYFNQIFKSRVVNGSVDHGDALIARAHNIHIDEESNIGKGKQRMFGIIFRTEQGNLLAAESHKCNGIAEAVRMFGEVACKAEEHGNSACIVVGAGEINAAHFSEVVVVS